MSDLYHPEVSDSFIGDVYESVRKMEQSAFQVLTKHGGDNNRDIPHPPDNMMLGVSVGHPEWRYRIDWLRAQPAQTKFVSFEPLVECIPEVDLTGIDWAIIGGESGPDHREMHPAWARNIIRSCRRQDTAAFFKQHSARKSESDQTIAYPYPSNGPKRIEEFPELPIGILPKPRKHMTEPLAAD